MSLPFNPIRAEPKLKDLLDLLKRDIFLTLNCHAIGTVQSFDATNQTAQITINYQKTLSDDSGDQSPISYLLLQNVPCIFLCGGKVSLSFPVAESDQVILLFNDRDISNWVQGATNGQVASPRLHSFNDAIALVGLNKISGFDAVRALLSDGNVKLGINPSSHKVTISNTAQGTLGSLLNTLIGHVKSLANACAAITVTGVTTGVGVSGVPSNASTFSTLASDLATDATNIQGLLE